MENTTAFAYFIATLVGYLLLITTLLYQIHGIQKSPLFKIFGLVLISLVVIYVSYVIYQISKKNAYDLSEFKLFWNPFNIKPRSSGGGPPGDDPDDTGGLPHKGECWVQQSDGTWEWICETNKDLPCKFINADRAYSYKTPNTPIPQPTESEWEESDGKKIKISSASDFTAPCTTCDQYVYKEPGNQNKCVQYEFDETENQPITLDTDVLVDEFASKEDYIETGVCTVGLELSKSCDTYFKTDG